MAYLNVVGFETGDTSELFTPTGTYSIQSTTKRTGAYALQCNPTTTGTGYVQIRGLAADGTMTTLGAITCYTTFYLQIGSLPSAYESFYVLHLQGASGDVNWELQVTSTGVCKLVRHNPFTSARNDIATGSTSLSTGVWYRIDFKGTYGASAAYEFKIDGTVEFSGTQTMGGTGVLGIALGKRADINGSTVNFYYDDIAISDSAYPGAGEVRILKPNADYLVNGFTGGWANVDEVPHDSDTTKLLGDDGWNNPAAKFDMESTATGGITGTIGTVKGVVVGKKRAAGTTNVEIQIAGGAGPTWDTGASVAAWLTTTYAAISRMEDTDPSTGAAWANVDSLKVGIQGVASTKGYIDITAIYAMVWCTGQINTTVTPGAASLTLTAYSPSAKVNNIATPGALSLTTTRYTPSAILNNIVTPGALSAALTAYAPAATVGLAVTPGTLATALTAYTPTVINPQSATPGAAALTLTPYAPGAVVNNIVTPGALSAVLSAYAPSAILNSIVTPGALSAALTAYAPSAIINNIVTPGTLATVLTAYEPSALLNSIVTPGALTTALTAYAPAALLNNIVTPGALSASLTAYAPSAIVNFIVTPGAGSLAIATYGINIYLSGSTFGARQYWRSTQHKEYTKLVPYRDYRRVTTYKDYIKSVKWVDRA